MNDIVSLLVLLTIIYGALIILTIFLLNKLYRSELVLGTKIKEVSRMCNYLEGINITSYFSFNTADNKKIIRTTSEFSNTKRGHKKHLFYNKDTDEIVGKIYTVIWESILLILNMFFAYTVGIPFFINAVLIILLTYWLYSRYYKNKYLNRSKK